MIAAAGFALASLPMLYAALIGLGVIAALFTPVKYGILPDHLAREELPAGNALVEGATFVAILCGIMFGGYAASHDRSSVGVAIQLMAIAGLCYGASLLSRRLASARRACAPIPTFSAQRGIASLSSSWSRASGMARRRSAGSGW